MLGVIQQLKLPLWLNKLNALIYPGQIFYADYDISLYQDSLFADNEIVLPNKLMRAVNKRKAEYLAGRMLANEIFKSLGLKKNSIDTGAMGEPIWPAGVRGSISHTRNKVICALHRSVDFPYHIGIDIERIMAISLANDIDRVILDEEERLVLKSFDLPYHQLITAAFSAKESFYKAIFPVVRTYLDFSSVKIQSINNNFLVLVWQQPCDLELKSMRPFYATLQFEATEVISFVVYYVRT